MVSAPKSAGLGTVSGNTANFPGSAASNVAPSPRPLAKRPRSRYYAPPAVIQVVPEVEKTEAGTAFDDYTGSLEQLVRSGLADPSMFPGQPGNGTTAATYLPIGCDGAAWHTPGRILISRHGHSGLYRIRLNVSVQERAARERAKEQQARDGAKRRFAWDLACLMRSVEALPIAEGAPLLKGAIAVMQAKLTSDLAAGEVSMQGHAKQHGTYGHLSLVATSPARSELSASEPALPSCTASPEVCQ